MHTRDLPGVLFLLLAALLTPPTDRVQWSSEHFLWGRERGVGLPYCVGETEPSSHVGSQPSPSAGMRPRLDASARDWRSHVRDTESGPGEKPSSPYLSGAPNVCPALAAQTPASFHSLVLLPSSHFCEPSDLLPMHSFWSDSGTADGCYLKLRSFMYRTY